MAFASTLAASSPSRPRRAAVLYQAHVWGLYLASALLFGPAPGRGEASHDGLDALPADLGAALSADAIYPHGRKLAFMGYSGNPSRDLTNGFTVAGPGFSQ